MNKKKLFPVLVIVWLVFVGCAPLTLAAGQVADAVTTAEPTGQAALPTQAALPSQPTLKFQDCTPEQQAILVQALDDARGLALNAFDTLKDTPEALRNTSARFHEWFGDYNPANYEQVLANFQSISSALATQPIIFSCSSSAGIFAYVTANQPYLINLCADYWDAPQLGKDSQAGILVHEMSHFTVVAGTTDEVRTRYYARTPGKWIPAETALVNASSYQFFAENDPAQ